MNYPTYGNFKQIIVGIAKKTPRGLMQGDTTVGYVTWQMDLRNDYKKLDGSSLANATTDYKDLLAYAVNNSLITTNPSNVMMFQYNATTDTLTLPDFTNLSLSTDLIPQIKYKKSTSVWETVDIGRFVATAPAYYQREDIFTTGKTAVIIPPCWVNIDGSGYVLEEPKTIDLTQTDNWDDPQYVVAANRAGKDFYIYAIKPAGSIYEPKFILSHNTTVPTGYTASNSRKIGGFHCLCLSVGTISGHTLSGYNTGDILPLSPWDLKHRAVSENEGMVWVPQVGKWVDIYLSSWDGSALASTFGATIADGASSPAFHGEKFAEYLGLVKKSLLWRDEFIVAAKGSNEGTNINGSANPVTTGGHIDTNSRRMISKYGLEDCCGALWQWARDCTEFYPGATWNPTTSQYLSGYTWQESPVYHAGTDSQKYGHCDGLLRRLVLGGFWVSGSRCGSRSASCSLFSAFGGGANVAGRGASEPR